MPHTYSINTHKVISENLEGETIIIHLETGCYYSLNKDGGVIWQTILENKPINSDTQEVENFLDFLVKENLVHEIQDADSPSYQEGVAEGRGSLVRAGNPNITKYTDMQEMLLADPVHDVDTAGWPNLKKE